MTSVSNKRTALRTHKIIALKPKDWDDYTGSYFCNSSLLIMRLMCFCVRLKLFLPEVQPVWHFHCRWQTFLSHFNGLFMALNLKIDLFRWLYLYLNFISWQQHNDIVPISPCTLYIIVPKGSIRHLTLLLMLNFPFTMIVFYLVFFLNNFHLF